MRRPLLTACLLIAPLLGPLAAFAQAPPAVPALPDTERRTAYSISANTCACNVNFALYGDGTDVDEWLQVWINGTRYLSTDPLHGWSLSSATGSLATIPRPITDAVLTFNAPQTGTVQIVGARRPRQLTQFTENRGVAARDLNQRLTDITAIERELWDKTNDLTGRGLFGLPGESIATMPSAAARAGKFLYFDATGLIPQFTTGGAGSGNVVGPPSSTVGDVALWNNTTGTLLADSGNTPVGKLTFKNGSSNGIAWQSSLSASDAAMYETAGNTIAIQTGRSGNFDILDQNANVLFNVEGPVPQAAGGTTNGNNFTFQSNVCIVGDELFTISGTPTTGEQPGFAYKVGGTTVNITYTVQNGDTNNSIVNGLVAAIKVSSALAGIINGNCSNGNFYNGTATAVNLGGNQGGFDVISTADPNLSGNNFTAINSAHTTVTPSLVSVFAGQTGVVISSFIPSRNAVANDNIFVGTYQFQDNTGAVATYLTDLLTVLSPTSGAVTFQRTWTGGGCGFGWSVNASSRSNYQAINCDLGLGANSSTTNNVSIFSGSAGTITINPGSGGVQIPNTKSLVFQNASANADSSIFETAGNNLSLQVGTAGKNIFLNDSGSNAVIDIADVSHSLASDTVNFNNTLDATALNGASVILAGGLAVNKQLRVGTTLTGADSGTWGSGGINGSNIGATTPGTGKFTSLQDTGLSTQGVTCNDASGNLSTSTTGCTNVTQNVAHGGTGATTLTGIVVGSGTSALTATQVTGAVKDNGSGTLSQAACADLSDSTTPCNASASGLRTYTEQGTQLISVNTITNATNYQDTTSITSACDDYEIVLTDIIPATNNVNLEMLLHSSGSFQNTSYVNAAGGATTYFDVISNGGNIGNVDGLSGFVYIFGVNSTVHKKIKDIVTYLTSAPAATGVQANGAWTGGTTAIDGFELVMSSGNISSGKVKVYCKRPAM